MASPLLGYRRPHWPEEKKEKKKENVPIAHLHRLLTVTQVSNDF